MKKQTIGFDRQLTLPWLDLTAGLLQEGLDQQKLRHILLTRLADEISGPEARKKTTSVLTRIWARVPPPYQALQSEALTLLPLVLAEERLWLHWGMTMLAYPFFCDVASTVGRLLHLQGEFESRQVRRRMHERWGQRTTLDRAIRRVLQTFIAWDVIQQTNSQHHLYQATPARHTANPAHSTSSEVLSSSEQALALWFMACVIHSVRQSTGQHDRQLPLAELIQSPATFPFDLTPHAATLRRSNRFEVSRQGLDLEMVSPV